jgi:hypothetical protein
LMVFGVMELHDFFADVGFQSLFTHVCVLSTELKEECGVSLHRKRREEGGECVIKLSVLRDCEKGCSLQGVGQCGRESTWS